MVYLLAGASYVVSIEPCRGRELQLAKLILEVAQKAHGQSGCIQCNVRQTPSTGEWTMDIEWSSWEELKAWLYCPVHRPFDQLLSSGSISRLQVDTV